MMWPYLWLCGRKGGRGFSARARAIYGNGPMACTQQKNIKLDWNNDAVWLMLMKIATLFSMTVIHITHHLFKAF